MKNTFVLFDFDGVIADTYEVAFETKKTMCPGVSHEDYRKIFEGNVNNVTIPEAYHNEDCNHDLDWFEVYVPKMREGAKLFPGMKEVILELEKEHTLIVISSTISFPIEEFLIAHDMRSHFDWVMGNDVHKSKVEKIKMVFDKHQTTAEKCVFVTDSLGDMHEAREMNVPAIGVTWGFCTPEVLKRGEPRVLVDTPEELLIAIRSHFS
jgi:phosphoglycolate phosphatase